MRNQIMHAGRARQRCSQCRALVPAASLNQGKCGACTVQPALPLRDNRGRYFSNGAHSAATLFVPVLVGGL